MVSEIRIFVEGDKALLNGFRAFLKPVIDVVRQRRIRFQLVSCKSTDETIKDFMDAVHLRPEVFNVLLIDSDRPDNGRLIASLKNRSTWDNQIGANVQDDQLHFMVQVMESWFLADNNALATYYGRGFQANRLRPNPNVEQIPGNDVISGLQAATRNTSQKRYHKTKHAPALLQAIDSDKVRNAAPNCRRLFTALENLT